MNTPSDYNAQSEPRGSMPERRIRRSSGGWVFGLILIGLGILLTVQNFSGFQLNNWWALFILLPAIGAFTAAWNNYKEAGRITGGVRASIFGGLVLCVVCAAFLFSMDWAILGPALIIAAGVGILINISLPK